MENIVKNDYTYDVRRRLSVRTTMPYDTKWGLPDYLGLLRDDYLLRRITRGPSNQAG
jgi:hypothetical protein